MITLVLVGLAVGLISSFFGVGGGVVMVPALYFLFPALPVQVVISTSLGVIFCNGIINTYHFSKQGKRPELKVISWLCLGMLIGGQLGTRLTFLLTPETVKLVFSFILVVVVIRILTKRPPAKTDDSIRPLINIRPLPTLLVGIAAGTIAGLSGLGGGILIVPALVVIYQIPFSWVPAYSNPAMVAGALSGILTFALNGQAITELNLGPYFDPLQIGHLNLGLIGVVVLSSTISSKLGAKLTGRVSPKTSQYAFAFLISVIALKMLAPYLGF